MPGGILRGLRPPGLWIPEAPLRIDWSHPLTQGLKVAYAPGVMRLADICGTGIRLTQNANPSLRQGAEGAGFFSSGASSGYKASIQAPGNNGTVFCRGVSVGTLTTNGVVFGINENGGDVLIGLYCSSTTQFGSSGVSGTTQIFGGTFTPTTNVPWSAGLTYAVGGTAIPYYNGAAGSTASQTTIPTQAGTWNVNLGYDDKTGTTSGNLIIYVGYYWTRTLSATEMRWLHLDPYAFLVGGGDDVYAPPLGPQLAQDFLDWLPQIQSMQKPSAYPRIDTNQPHAKSFIGWTPTETPDAKHLWTEPPYVLRPPSTLDTNQFDLSQPPSITNIYTTVGAGSFVVPADVYSLTARGIGGGGGGGGSTTGAAAGGGGGGAYAESTITVTPGQTVWYNVGSAGSAGFNGNGGNGGDSWLSKVSNAAPA